MIQRYPLDQMYIHNTDSGMTLAEVVRQNTANFLRQANDEALEQYKGDLIDHIGSEEEAKQYVKELVRYFNVNFNDGLEDRFCWGGGSDD